MTLHLDQIRLYLGRIKTIIHDPSVLAYSTDLKTDDRTAANAGLPLAGIYGVKCYIEAC